MSDTIELLKSIAKGKSERARFAALKKAIAKVDQLLSQVAGLNVMLEAGHKTNAELRGVKDRLEDIIRQQQIAIVDAVENPPLVPMIIWCPACKTRHVDEGEWATKKHHTHSCQHCGLTWRPAVVPTVGVQFLPGFKNGDDKTWKK